MSKSTNDYNLDSIDSLGRLPLSEQVYVTLRQAIITGSLEPDTKLNEVRIAEQLNVSATPVREAFRKLAKDNLVVIRPWRGVTVKGYSPEEIISIYQCREVLEGLGARLCAEVATDEELEEIKHTHEIWSQSHDEQQVIYNMQFHNLIMHCSKNDRLVDYLARYKEMVNRDMYISGQNKIRTDACRKEHQDIVTAILERNGKKAEEKMRRHIRNAFAYKKARAEYKKNQNEKIETAPK